MPKVLLGDTRSRRNLEALREHGWGRMYVDRLPQPYDGEPWGFDNGAFYSWQRGQEWREVVYLRRLERARTVASPPYIAIVPDIVAAGLRSLEFSWNWFSVRCELPVEWNWYLAVQDGMTRRDVEGVIRAGWSGLFLGGTDRFKRETAWQWAELAHEFGLFFHYGRAGTLRKLEHAKQIEADSLDSTFPLWTSSRLARFVAQFYDQRQSFLDLS